MLPPISTDMPRPAYQHLQSGQWSYESTGAGAGESSVESRGSRVRPTLGQSCSPGSGGDDGGGCRERRRSGRFPEPEQRWRRRSGTSEPPYRSVSRCRGDGLRQHACAHEPLRDLGDRPLIPELRSEVTLYQCCDPCHDTCCFCFARKSVKSCTYNALVCCKDSKRGDWGFHTLLNTAGLGGLRANQQPG